MTLNDLRKELSALGFEREIEADTSFLTAIRRALSTIYAERGVYKAFFIEHRPIMPTLVVENLVHSPNENESFTIKGAAYSFYVSGKGSYKIAENGIETEHSFNTIISLQRGFINKEATITFHGDLAFKVSNLAVFGEREFDDEKKLFAYGEPFEYKMCDLRDDFYSFSSLPTDEKGDEIKGARLFGESIFIPWDYVGKINLTYRATPPKVSLDTPDLELEVPKETELLIPLLAASYYWLDDSPDKAERYYLSYNEALNSVKRTTPRSLGGGYKNVTGWA